MEKSFLQSEAEMSKFNPQLQNIPSVDLRSEDIPIIPHQTHVYDPSHPDADWGGFVPRNNRKRITRKQSSSLTSDQEGGIIPQTESGGSLSGKRIYQHDLKYRSVDNAAVNSPMNSAVYQVGPGGQHNCADWKTQTQLHFSGDHATVKEKPKNPVKKQITPQYEQYNHSYKRSSNQVANAPRRGQSLLAGIGRTLATSSHLPNSSSANHNTYLDTSNKALLSENRHNFALGYAGLRKENVLKSKA